MKVNWWVLLSVYGIVDANIMGVSPQNKDAYTPYEYGDGILKWRCIGDPSIIINFDQINDDYCDCPDGSDEIGTNACPYSDKNMFYCANNGHFPRYIENFKLNDGVCDYDICCDGTDEYVSGKCPDKCKEIHEQYENHKQTLLQSFGVARSTRKRILDDARDSKSKARTKLDESKLKKAELDNLMSKLNSKLKKLSTVSEPKREAVIFDKISPFIDKIADKANSIEDSHTNSQKKIAQLESMLESLASGYNPNFNDAAVKSAVNKYQNYASNKQEQAGSKAKEINEDIDDLIVYSKTEKIGNSGLNPKQIVPSVHGLVHHYIGILFKYFDPEFAEMEQEMTHSPETKSTRLEALEIKIKSTEKTLKETERLIELLEANLELDFGEDDILRGIVGKSVTTSIGGYEYKVGLMNAVYQDSNLLGKYSHHENGKLYYNNGHRCWNGPLRSVVVELQCGKAHEIVSISEPEKCEYLIVVNSPVGCKEVTDNYIDETFKVDYSLL